METKFQTSFIPKKSQVQMGGAVAPKVHHSTSLFMLVGGFLFLLSLAAAGGAYVYKNILISDQASYKQQLADREKKFNVTLIEDLKRADTRIDLTTNLLAKHLALSQIFDVIGKITTDRVRFTTLDIVNGQAKGVDEVKIKMKGYGTSLPVVAWQSDVLGQLEQYGVRNVVKNPILSDPSDDGKGKVAFDLSADIDPKTLTYSRMVKGDAQADTSGATSPTNKVSP
jgi:hypothetical protein